MIPRKSLFSLAEALDGLPILGALPGTPAARAGVRYGDILLSVNGKRVRTVNDYVEAKNLRTDGMDVIVFRSGEERIIALSYEEGSGAAEPAALLAELVTLRLAGAGFDDDDDPTHRS